MEETVLLEALTRTRSRGQVKTLGRTLDTDPEARRVAILVAHRRGVDTPEDLDGRRLVKALLAREESARERLNPIRVDAAFSCVNCERDVERGGARVRDHCPHCLYGLHVDVVPGDRAADCGGVLVPVDLSLEGRSGVIIAYRCSQCGSGYRTRAHPEDSLPEGLRLPTMTDETGRGR